MDFGRKREFRLDGEDPPEKVSCRKESYFLEFMYVDVVRDFVTVVFNVLLDGARGFHNYRDCCFEPPHSFNLDFQVFLVFFKLFRGFYAVLVSRGISSVNEKAGFVLLVI